MKCIRCGEETSRRICPTCLSNWSKMKEVSFNALTLKYGELTQANHQKMIKDMKRLERIWRKDRESFNIEIDKITKQYSDN